MACDVASLLVMLSSLLLSHIQGSNALHFETSFNKSLLLGQCHFVKIYNLGDSLSDTGNLIRESPQGAMSNCGKLPYGETFFKHPTGRCSNGLLMIDFIALASGLPPLHAYKETNTNSMHSINFAVAGATALSSGVLAARNISNPQTNSSLDVQLEWLHSYFNSTCLHSPIGCEAMNAHSLFLVGEIGGNDYNYALFQGNTIKQLQETMVPLVVQTISNAVRRVIHYGARRILVPGPTPFGCNPSYLTPFQTNDSTAYDELGCLKDHNNLAAYHNEVLQKALQKLRVAYPHTTIAYVDYYNAFLWVLRNAGILGYDVRSTLKACCGIGGAYNYNTTRGCGDPGVPVCSDPRTHISWDGIHFTQKTYKLMTSWFIKSNILPQMRHCIP